jgi:hypothetical protein
MQCHHGRRFARQSNRQTTVNVIRGLHVVARCTFREPSERRAFVSSLASIAQLTADAAAAELNLGSNVRLVDESPRINVHTSLDLRPPVYSQLDGRKVAPMRRCLTGPVAWSGRRRRGSLYKRRLSMMTSLHRRNKQ